MKSIRRTGKKKPTNFLAAINQTLYAVVQVPTEFLSRLENDNCPSTNWITWSEKLLVNPAEKMSE